MTRGRSGRRYRERRPERSEREHRRIQSPMAKAASIRRARMAENQRIERMKAGEALIDIITRYLEESGLTGTAGAPTNPAQAAASAVEDATRAKPGAGDARVVQKGGLTDAYAVAVKIPQRAYSDILAYLNFMGAWDVIVYQWEERLQKGKYIVYRCLDYGQTTEPGLFFLTVGIATDSSYLKKFRDDILGKDFQIESWKEIEGKALWPQPPKGTPPPSRHRTFKQG